jgi:uncharacterized repeat protein (TIGR03803 family)
MKKYFIFFLFLVSVTTSAQYTDIHDFGSTNGGYSSLTFVNNKLYGTLSSGGTNGGGCIYSINTDGTGFTIMYNFPGSFTFPCGSLLYDNGVLYGMTSQGSEGIYKINIDGTGFSILHTFAYNNPNDGSSPQGSLIISGNVLYGMTRKGGTFYPEYGGDGVIFKINKDGTNFSILHSFVSGEDYPYGSLVLVGNSLYGMSSSHGSSLIGGVIFKINIDGSGYSILHNFGGADGSTPNGSLVASGNTLYGMTVFGGNLFGSVRKGNVFKINTDGSGFQSIFNDLNGSVYYTWSYGSLVLVGNVLYGKSNRNLYSLNTDGTNYQYYNWGSYGSETGSFDPQENGCLTYGNGALYGVNNRYGGAGNGVIYKFVPANLNSITFDTNRTEINIYPNPANDHITIDCGNLANVSGWTIKIVNTLSQEVFSGAMNTQQYVVPLNSWSGQGVYFVKIYDASNNLMNTKKIILQ